MLWRFCCASWGTVSPAPDYVPIGCWKAALHRGGAIVSLETAPYKVQPDAVSQCAAAAQDKGSKAFVLQGGGRCGAVVEPRLVFHTHEPHAPATGCHGKRAAEVYVFRQDLPSVLWAVVSSVAGSEPGRPSTGAAPTELADVEGCPDLADASPAKGGPAPATAPDGDEGGDCAAPEGETGLDPDQAPTQRLRRGLALHTQKHTLDKVVTKGLKLSLDVRHPPTLQGKESTWPDGHGWLQRLETRGAVISGGLLEVGPEQSLVPAFDPSQCPALTLEAWVSQSSPGKLFSEWPPAGATAPARSLNVTKSIRSTGPWVHLVVVFEKGGAIRTYAAAADGDRHKEQTQSARPQRPAKGQTAHLHIGGVGKVVASLAVARAYCRALSGDDVRQNFLALRGEFRA